MAPMTVSQQQYIKRSASSAGFDLPAAKKLHRRPLRHHKATYDFQRDIRQGAQWQDEGAVQDLLTRSIGLALEAVGFEATAPEALESFRVHVEEYMAHYLADVRQSMLSCRRTQAIPQDFLQALHTHQLSLRSLLPHLDPPVDPSRSQLPLPAEPAQEEEQQNFQFLGPILNSAPSEKAKAYVPKHFPEFPSKHTYQATPEFPNHDMDPRKVRERATEEGRLGEEALRRLVSSGAGNKPHESEIGSRTKSMRARRNQMWIETMQAVTQSASEGQDHDMMACIERGKQKEGELPPDFSFGSGRLGSAVNAEKRYWRKPATQRREANGNI